MKEEHKTSKALKGQLLGAISMMLVAAIALGTSTYAWFINNNVVQVENMNLQVSTSTAMLVEVQKVDMSTYTAKKSVVTNADITGAAEGNWTGFLTNPMVPASITDANLKTTTIADREAKFFATNNHVANNKLDEFLPLAHDATATGVGQGPVKRLTLRFSANTPMDVYFGASDLENIADMITKTTSGATVGTADAAAQATAIKKALRVAVVPNDTVVTPVVFQFDGGTVGVAGNNTDYQYVTAKPFTPQQNEANGLYDAISTVDGSKHITASTVLTANLPKAKGTDYLATVTAGNGTATGTVTAPTTTGKTLFQLDGTTAKVVDIYIWLEGTDNDCLNELSNYQFNLRLPFAGAPTTP